MIHRTLALIYKELLTMLKDRKVRMVLIFPPLIQLFVFAWAATLDVKSAPIGIWNRDLGERSWQLIERFYDSHDIFKGFMRLESPEQVQQFLDNEEGLLVLSIAEDFSRRVDAQTPARVQLLLDGRHSNTTQILVGYIAQMLDSFNRSLNEEWQRPAQRTALVRTFWFNPNLIYLWYTVPSLVATLIMVIGLTLTSLSIAREKELGTFDQLLIVPLRPFEILLGKSLPAILVGLIEGSVITLVAIFLFGIPFSGSFFLLYASLLVFVCCIVGVGLFLSSMARTQQQAILATSLFITPSVLLSGFATPIENMPHGFQVITWFNPLRYMMVIVKGIFLKNMPAHIVWQNVWPMILIAIATLTLAGWSFRRRLE